MNRRSFLGQTPIWAMAASSQFGGLEAQSRGTGNSYGSGHFGEWTEDEFGLPAFRYTCDQTTDPKAVTRLTPGGILQPTEHVHQVGNDRLAAIVSNYGTVRVRQDEGAPKFLNDYDPKSGQFAGGIGYLVGPDETLSTLYRGGAGFERIFGVGYFRKTVSGAHYQVDQTIAAPFGDDPVLLSQVTVVNHGKQRADLRWIEYWGCQPHQFSFRPFMEAFMGANPAELRRRSGRRFVHTFEALAGGAGIGESKRYPGDTPAEIATWTRLKTMLAANPNAFLGAVHEPGEGAWFEDPNPPATFLVSLDAPPAGMSANAGAFFGAGGAEQPAGLHTRLDGKLEGAENSGLLLERTLSLNPGERKTLSFLYGYLPAGFDAGALAAKYRGRAATLLRESSAEWKKRGLTFSVAGEPWVARESAWNHYCVRSSLTYDDYFGERILSQGGIYQYVMGFQGAARDPLQHALPFIFSEPEIMKSVLRYTLKEVRADGSVPYAIVGHGVVAPLTTDNSSDMPLWLLWVASEYILATRDQAFLAEQIPAREESKASSDSVANLLARCYRHLVRDVGVGQHGVMRMLNDDWNDALVAFWAQKAMKECVEQGESVLNSAMAAWVFSCYAEMLRFTGGGAALADEVDASAKQHRKAVADQWNGQWLRRAWLGPTLGWVGEKSLWLEPQPWAILSGALDSAQTGELVRAIDENLRKGAVAGAVQMGPGPDAQGAVGTDPGTSVNGGIWPSLNQTLIWALARVDPAMAWDEWKRNSFARHAETYPDIWYGVWSGSDTYNSPHSKAPGETVTSTYLHYTDFPVLNLHSHACPLYSAAKLLALEFNARGFGVNLRLPVEAFRFESPLVGVVKEAVGKYQGWYEPAREGTWTISLSLDPKEASHIAAIEVNGKKSRTTVGADGVVRLEGAGGPGRALRWKIG
ncbi:MAG TPA: hypothetical protein VHW09_22060 [Bryobacteraceae bacterium]|jgi:hypothetical protein|nr:hypothetical protein [Bryobacteraceae bacterium]